MVKSVVKFFSFFCFFVISLVVVGKVMNRGHDNLTMEMAPAAFPLVTMVMDGVEYNQLHGYSGDTDIAFQRDTVTVLGEGRNTGFAVDAYGAEIKGISIEVRSADGSRLIENTRLSDFRTSGDRIEGNIALKDLIERDTEYSLAIILDVEGEGRIFYYTRVVWSSDLHASEKLDYCIDFHERLYDREAAAELTKYLETNSKLEDNSSFHKVNIHSSFRQITWGDLDVEEVGKPVVNLKDIAPQTASIVIDYIVSTSEEGNDTYYMVQEYFRIRYTADRMYLLDYDRTMTQIPDEERMCANDKILLGITGTDIPMMESEDGNVIVFEEARQLFSYDVTTNKLTVLFRFYDRENRDARTLYGQHQIRILDVGEGGDVQFAVYGYMNRGRHEGEVGVQLYTYSSTRNTIEELVYIPYNRTYAVLAAEMEKLLYMNRDQKLYLTLNSAVYRVDLVERTYSCLVEVTQDEGLMVSENCKVAVWPEGEDIYGSQTLNIRNLGSDVHKTISAAPGEAIRPLGFMDEDIIYGVAYTADVVEDSKGGIFFPMYKICICNSAGRLLKEYSQEDIYVTGCIVMDNQITLERIRRLESGAFQDAAQDHIMYNAEPDTGRNMVVTVDIDKYERYVQIKARKDIDGNTLKILTPKEVVYEGGRKLLLPKGVTDRYYVYGPYGVSGIHVLPAGAVKQAYDLSGVVLDESGERIWIKGNRRSQNQIMAIREASATEERSALAVCLDTMLAYGGISRNSQYFLDRGDRVLQILEDNLEDADILDLRGCSLDAVLYYVNRDIPVLALLEDGSAVLLVGFNELNTVIMNPAAGTVRKMGMNDSRVWFEENGNQFITYIRHD